MNERLRQAREKLHLSSTYVAKCLCVSTEELTAIEDGTRRVTGVELAVFSKLYGISADKLQNGYTYSDSDLRLLAGLSGLTDHDRNEVRNLLDFRRRLCAAM